MEFENLHLQHKLLELKCSKCFSQFSVTLRDHFSSTRNNRYNGIDVNGVGVSVNYTELIRQHLQL